VRALAAATAALCCLIAGPASAHPGHGAEPVTIEGDSFSYSPQNVTVAIGQPVIWFWKGTIARNHSVTADPGQAEQFDSDPHGPPDNQTHPEGDYFSHTFRTEGRFTYHCKVHPDMTGVVEVIRLPGQGPPLKLSKLRVTPRAEKIKVRFRITARADLALRIGEHANHRWRTVKSVYRSADKGANRLKLPVRDLEDGPYRLTVTAYDAANRRTEARKRFSLG
jgi:plastocyanin